MAKIIAIFMKPGVNLLNGEQTCIALIVMVLSLYSFWRELPGAVMEVVGNEFTEEVRYSLHLQAGKVCMTLAAPMLASVGL